MAVIATEYASAMDVVHTADNWARGHKGQFIAAIMGVVLLVLVITKR